MEGNVPSVRSRSASRPVARASPFPLPPLIFHYRGLMCKDVTHCSSVALYTEVTSLAAVHAASSAARGLTSTLLPPWCHLWRRPLRPCLRQSCPCATAMPPACVHDLPVEATNSPWRASASLGLPQRPQRCPFMAVPRRPGNPVLTPLPPSLAVPASDVHPARTRC